MIENFDKMLSGSLNLEEPWYILGAEFKEREPAIHVHVAVRGDAAFICPHCGTQTKRYGYEPKERSWRHADCLFYPCYVHCRRPRLLCENCGVIQLNAPFERKNSRFTLMFEGYAMLIMADVPRARASRLLRCDEKSLASILTYWVKDAVDNRSLSDVKSIAIDETSFKRGHSYVTVTIDSNKRQVIDVQKGRDKAAVAAMADKLLKQDGRRDNIQVVTSDMSASFLPAIHENFPEAKQIVDKFHVKQAMLKALDHVRKDEQREVTDKKQLFNYRKIFMVPQHRMTDNQIERVQSLSKQYPKTGRAFRIVKVLDDFYAASNIEEAEGILKHLCSWMRRSRLEPMKETAMMLRRHYNEILNYFNYRLTNAICEGINSMIQAAKRKARGFHTFDGFASMIYLVAGKLQFSLATPF